MVSEEGPVFEPWDHPLSTCAIFSEKLTFLTAWYAHARVRIKGVRDVSFSQNSAYALNG